VIIAQKDRCIVLKCNRSFSAKIKRKHKPGIELQKTTYFYLTFFELKSNA
jgi:hypothetical protein